MSLVYPCGPAGSVNTATSGFTPASLPNLLAWYKADTTTLFSDAGTTPAVNAGPVQQWNDKSGNGYHLKATSSGRRLTLNTTGLNSKRTLLLASGTSLSTSLGVAMGTGAACSAFFVGAIDLSSANNTRFLGYGVSGNNADYEAGGGALMARNDGTGVYSLRAPTFAIVRVDGLTTNAPVRLGLIYDGTNGTAYANNVAGTPMATTTAFADGGLILLNTNGPGAGQDTVEGTGKVSEIVITTAALSSGDRSSLDTYFQSEWGF
jgi:hypothetical protein